MHLPPIERRRGELVRMEKPQRRAANRLIKKHCCNFKNCHCLLLDTGEAIECSSG